MINDKAVSTESVLNIELQLKNGRGSGLQGTHGEYVGIIKYIDKFSPANALFALSRLDLMVLHPAGLIGSGTIDKIISKRNRGGHEPQVTHIKPPFLV
ncbi:hypothetical protein GCM10009122_36700 [Fulvivirga kasyanovii]